MSQEIFQCLVIKAHRTQQTEKCKGKKKILPTILLPIHEAVQHQHCNSKCYTLKWENVGLIQLQLKTGEEHLNTTGLRMGVSFLNSGCRLERRFD